MREYNAVFSVNVFESSGRTSLYKDNPDGCKYLDRIRQFNNFKINS